MQQPDNTPSPARAAGSETELSITTTQGEHITYRRDDAGYWSATQEGMPDVWGLSRVASRALDELAAARRDSARLDWLERMAHDVEAHSIGDVTIYGSWTTQSVVVGNEEDIGVRGEAPTVREAIDKAAAQFARPAMSNVECAHQCVETVTVETEGIEHGWWRCANCGHGFAPVVDEPVPAAPAPPAGDVIHKAPGARSTPTETPDDDT